MLHNFSVNVTYIAAVPREVLEMTLFTLKNKNIQAIYWITWEALWRAAQVFSLLGGHVKHRKHDPAFPKKHTKTCK